MKAKTYSADQQSKVLGVTPTQVRTGLLRNAKAIRAYSDKDLKRWGKTREEANITAADYEARGKAR